MKRILLSLLFVLALSLSACSLTQFIPNQNSDVNNSDGELNDSFDLVDVTIVGDDLENTSVDDVVVDDKDASDVETDPESLILTTIEASEGDLISLADLLAEDPDGDSVQYFYSEPFNDRGLWQTNDGDEGKYLVDLTATDGVLSTTEQIRVIVSPSNKGPVIDCPAKFTVSEGDLIDLPCAIYDKEGDKVSYAVTGFMSDLTYQTDFEDAGDYVVIVTATDGAKTTVKEIDLTIENVNRKPVVDDITLISVLEGEDVVINVDASDADGDELEIDYPQRFNEDGVWKTSRGDAGTYEFEVIVSDGSDVVILPVEVSVGKINVAPIINPINTIEVNEGETINLPIKVLDEDGDDVSIEISGFMSTETYITTFDDAGDYTVTIEATDGKHTVSQDVEIIVNDVNRPPVFIVK